MYVHAVLIDPLLQVELLICCIVGYSLQNRVSRRVVVNMVSLPLLFLLVVVVASCCAAAFHPAGPQHYHYYFGSSRQQAGVAAVRASRLHGASSSSSADNDNVESVLPQAFATGYSAKVDLLEALQEATESALQGLPKPCSARNKIDLGIVTISSLYDGQSSNSGPSVVVPAVLSSASVYGDGIQNLIGCTSGGIISSVTSHDQDSSKSACHAIESEGVPGVSVTLCILPEVEIKTFHVLGDDVPDEVGKISAETWKNAVGLRGFGTSNEKEDGPPAFMLIPSPAFQNDLDDLLQGLSYSFPKSLTFGAIASTVSSLSRARLFRYDALDSQCIQTLADGCVGVALSGDLQITTMIAQGAKPVGGVYRIVSGQDSTIKAIALDEVATKELKQNNENENDNNEEETSTTDAADYAKAMMPKPILAEANFVMKTLSDDDVSFMKKALLVGLERGGSLGRTPNELARLAEGKGHSYEIHQVASAGMKDGSVTLPLGSVNIQPGTRLRFFVREGDFARKEVEALWMGYKKKTLEESFFFGSSDDDEGKESKKKQFEPCGCLILSTLDRGTKLFGGKPGYESEMATTFLPTLPAVSGIFSNGILGRLDDGGVDKDDSSMVHGSAAEYVLIGSKSRRPVYSPAQAATEEAAAAKKKAKKDAEKKALEEEDEKRIQKAQSPLLKQLDQKAPRSEDGELILKRREVHSGRAMTVSTVEWSVAEKTATPTSVLEGFMWDKETEVDRLRERVPLANLVSQCRLYTVDPTKPKPRDWIGAIMQAASDGNHFVIIPECKRMEPVSGSLRKRYDVVKLIKQLTLAGAPAFSINCDSVLYGGSLDDVTKAREASSAAAAELSAEDGVVVPPILASDLLLYPYQLYKLRLAGADAVNLVAGALAAKDLLYLTKIASSLQLQVVASVTSETQIRALKHLEAGQIAALIVSNRELEDFSFDMTGDQALDLLASDALKEFQEKHNNLPILVEGRVGIIERIDDSAETATSAQYIKELKEAGATGAIVGGGLVAAADDDAAKTLEKLVAATC